jgi:mannose-1-phosphate guanylyltransferase
MFAVVMCGGSGTRFWPVSRQERPKQFLNITGRGPMVVETCDRLHPLIQDPETILVLGEQHLTEAQHLFEGRGVHMLAEPVGRNTAPCMGLGAIYARHLGCTGPVAFLPADHYIADPQQFLEDLQAAGELVDQGGIATLGIVPSRPETGYGYIKRGKDQVMAGDATGYRVSRFVEKPDLETARGYLTSGDYYWNAGIFVASPETILKEIKTHLPELYQGLERISEAVSTDRFETELKAVYNSLAGVSFDYGVMEHTREAVFVIPSACGWSDVGTWSALVELKGRDADAGQNIAEGDALLIACEGSYVSGGSGRLVACLGLKNALVVDTPDALLVADLDRSQDIREIVEQLRQRGKDHLL